MNIQEIKMLKWDPETLPLSNKRYPFKYLSNTTIEAFVNYVEAFPCCLGRMARLIKRYLSIPQICPKEFVMKEAHIDINYCNHELEEKIISIGFEPDHFHTLNPPEYTKCYTMRCELEPTDSMNIIKTHTYMKKALQKMQFIINKSTGIYSYTELETYSHKSCEKFKFRPIEAEGLLKFPFKEMTYSVTDESFKKVDIHVKIPVEKSGPAFYGLKNPNMFILRQILIASGFYEILSLSGNAIYTLQLINIQSAHFVFNNLCSWAQKYGGVTFIGMEYINEFWRKEEDLYGKKFLSPIPKIMKLTFN